MNKIWHLKKFEHLTPLELYKILQLRIDVFVVEQNCPYPECDDKDLKSLHLWCEIQDEMVAYCRILPQQISYPECSIGRVVTKSSARGQNLGHQLMKFALEIINNQFHSQVVRISAQSYLRDFYQSHGFEIVSDEYLEDEIPHIEMLKN